MNKAVILVDTVTGNSLSEQAVPIRVGGASAAFEAIMETYGPIFTAGHFTATAGPNVGKIVGIKIVNLNGAQNEDAPLLPGELTYSPVA